MEFLALAIIGTLALVVGPMIFSAFSERKRH